MPLGTGKGSLLAASARDASPYLFTAADTGLPTLYWFRAYENPAGGVGEEYVWLGSTNHDDGSTTDTMARGFSSSPDMPPSSWTTFNPPHAGSQEETPHFVYNPSSARPFWLYYHPNSTDGGGTQGTRLATYDTDWTGGTDEGEVLPTTASLDHTGYAVVERTTSTDWKCWSLMVSGVEQHGYWTSSDGTTWTNVNSDISGRPSDTFIVGSQRYAVGGGGLAGHMQLATMSTPVQVDGAWEIIWDPDDHGIAAADVTSVRALQDPSDETLLHLYITTVDGVFYDTYVVPDDPIITFTSTVAHSAWDLYEEDRTDATAISSLVDRTGNGHGLSQGTSSKRPTAKDAGATLKVARFDGTDDSLPYISAQWDAITQPTTVIVLAKYDNADTANRQLLSGPSGDRQVIFTNVGGFKINAGATVSGSTDDGDWHVFVAVFDGASSELYLDGGTPTTGNAGAQGMDSFVLGRSDTEAAYWDGDVNWCGVYDGDLVTADLTLLNDVGQALRDRANAAGLTIAAWTDIT